MVLATSMIAGVRLWVAQKYHLSRKDSALSAGWVKRSWESRRIWGAPPPVSPQWVYGQPDRLRRRSQRRHAEPAAVRALQRGGRGRNFRGGTPVQHDADGPERIAPSSGRQPRPRSGTAGRDRSCPRQTAPADG